MAKRRANRSNPQQSSAEDALKGRRILAGLCGGIACYKVCEVVSRLVQRGADVSVLMTPAATQFVGPLTLQALSGRPVYTSVWDHIESSDPQHIALARSADVLLIAPCTMDMLAKLATGRCDDVVSLAASAMDRTRQKAILAPSMNAAMWAQPANQRNLRTLHDDGYEFVGPGTGWQACRTDGVGRMSEPQEIIAAVERSLLD